MKCQQCNLDFYRCWRLVEGADALCTSCFKAYHGFYPPGECAVRFDESSAKVCDICRNPTSQQWYFIMDDEFEVCQECFDVHTRIKKNEKKTMTKCDECGEGTNSWYPLDVEGTMFLVCASCFEKSGKGSETDTVTNNASTTATLFYRNGEPVITTTPTTAIVPVVNKTTKIYCGGCWNEVTVAGEFCDKCKAFNTMMDNMSDGTNGEWFETIDIGVLRQYCVNDEEWFWTLPNAQHIEVDKTDNYTFFDNGSNILAVGHLDIAGSLDRSKFKYGLSDKGHHYVFNANLDDRLGVFVLHYLLPTMYGIQFDMLMTTNEESGGTTSEDYQKAWLALPEEQRKKYNWIIEFDRRGTDVVLYAYDCNDLRTKVGEFATVGNGSFSDISRMQQMGCKAMNWGVGYESEHTNRSYAILENTLFMVENFIKFYNEYKDTHLPHTYVAAPTYGGRYNTYGYDDDVYGYMGRWPSTTYNSGNRCDKCYKHVNFRYQFGVRKLCAACYQLETGMRIDKNDQPVVCEYCQAEKDFVYLIEGVHVCHECFIKPFHFEDEVKTLDETFGTVEVDWVCEQCGDEDTSIVVDGSALCSACYDARNNTQAHVYFCDKCDMSGGMGDFYEVNGARYCRKCYGF